MQSRRGLGESLAGLSAQESDGIIIRLIMFSIDIHSTMYLWTIVFNVFFNIVQLLNGH